MPRDRRIVAASLDRFERRSFRHYTHFLRGRRPQKEPVWASRVADSRPILINLYKMNRFKDCLYIIAKILKNSQAINDTYFFTRAKEIEIMIYMQE